MGGHCGLPVRGAGLPLRCCNLARWHRPLAAGCTDYHHRLTALVFRRQAHLVAGKVHGNRAGLAGRGEIQGPPIDGDLAGADAEKAAEVDDGRADCPSRLTMISTMRPISSSALL